MNRSACAALSLSLLATPLNAAAIDSKPAFSLPAAIQSALSRSNLQAVRKNLSQGSQYYFQANGFTRYAYGDDPRNAVYLALPPDAPPKMRLVVLVHGGSFLNGSARDASMAPLAEYFLSRHYAVATVDYRLLTDTRWPAPLEDIAAGTRKATDILGDRTAETVLVGFSAGAVAGALLLYGTPPSATTMPPIDRFIGLSGLYSRDAVADPPIDSIRTRSLEKLDILSVLSDLGPPRTQTPALLVEGSGDQFADKYANTDRSHAETLARLLGKYQIPVTTYWVNEDGFNGHLGPLLMLSVDDSALSHTVDDFLTPSVTDITARKPVTIEVTPLPDPLPTE